MDLETLQRPLWNESVEGNAPEACLLMFSGGRDSTLAAIRLQKARTPLALVTVTSGHLFGLESVQQRVRELARHLPPETEWIVVRQPEDLRTDVSFYEQTCLPCHHAYVVVSGVIARQTGATNLAFGYAAYQSDWPEQTPIAVSRLTAVLARHGITLVLPTYDIASRAAALDELRSHGLSTDALEQKCIRQVTNVALDVDRLEMQVTLWESAINASMSELTNITVPILSRTTVGAVSCR